MLLKQQLPVGGDLEGYLGSIARRLRAAAATQGFGALALTGLAATCLCVWLANRVGFSSASVLGSRTFLAAALGTVAALLLVRPLLRLARGRALSCAADEAERRSARFGGRLRTWVDEKARAANRGRAPSPLLGLLAKDAEQAASAVPLDFVVSRARMAALAAAGCLGLTTLLWLGTSGPGYWQYGTAKLWAGWFLAQDEPLYALRVEPGDATIRRGGRLDVTAVPVGFEPGLVEIHAKFESSVDWERAPMSPRLQGGGYAFSFALVREPLRYYVEAGRLRSREFEVGVVALPAVESIRLEYEFPGWSGLAPSVEDPGGDISAVPGTRVAVVLTTDKPLEGGRLIVDGDAVPVRGSRAEIEVAEDGAYHVAALYRGELVRLTEDYFITAVPDRKPEVRIVEPGRDWRASSIEEVAVRARASDDFGLRRFELRYAVNGVAQEPVALPLRRGAERAEAGHLFCLEDFGEPGSAAAPPAARTWVGLPPAAPEASLIPGDIISYYAVAADAKREVRTDMYFVTVQPFERRFSQSQQAGGQGAAGQRQDEISRRQKEIALATWNLIQERDAEDGREESKLRESAAMLAELQATLMQQAQTLVQRTRARQLTARDPQFERFAELLERAAKFMEPAAEALAEYRLDDAVSPEQQALQYLLRAEALFTDIQLSMSQNGAGGGASRDLAEMFELEMDMEKNQYETGGGASGQQLEQEVDEAMRKLEELARRQERLADRAEDRDRASFEQRWQQEMLRREAEDLKRQLEQLQRRQQGQQQASAAGGARAQSAGGQGSRQDLSRAIERLERASEEMQRGSRGGDPRAAAAGAQRELRQAAEELAQHRQRQGQRELGALAQEAEELVDEQERTAAAVDKSLQVALQALRAQGGRNTGNLPTGMTRAEEMELADRKRELGARLAEVERRMQRQAQLLREQDRETSRALTNALLDLQQSDAAPAIQNASQLIRRGLAPYVASNEEAVSRALRRLRDNLREAGELAQQAGGGEDARARGLEQLLADVERLRRGLEEAAESGAQPGGGNQGVAQSSPGDRADSSRLGGGQGGQQPGAQREGRGPAGSTAGPGGAQGGRRGGWGRAGSTGEAGWRSGWTPLDDDRVARERVERALEAGAAEVPQLTRRLRQRSEFDPEDIAELRRFAQSLGDGRFLGNPALLEREYRQMLALLEQLEVQLRRQVELDDKEEVRAAVAEQVPEPYREAVAEYFRKLAGTQ